MRTVAKQHCTVARAGGPGTLTTFRYSLSCFGTSKRSNW